MPLSASPSNFPDPHELVRNELRILNSGLFARASVKASFLKYLVEEELENRGAFLKESTIAVGFFKKPADIDLRRFSGVRVIAKQVRDQLRIHYYYYPFTTARIVLEAGSYRPTFLFLQPVELEPVKDARPLVALVLPVATFPEAAKLGPLAAELRLSILEVLHKSHPEIRFEMVTELASDSSSNTGFDYVLELSLQTASVDGCLQFTVGFETSDRGVLAIESTTRPDNEWRLLIPDLVPLVNLALSELRIHQTRSVNEQKRLTRDFLDWLEGYASLERRTQAGITRAVQRFDEILERNGNHSAALAGSAEVLLIYHHYTEVPANQGWREALRRAQESVRLDANNAEAHAALAYAKLLADHDFQGAERIFKFALDLDPRNHRAHHWYCNLLTMQGRFAEAILHAQGAYALKATSPIVSKILGDPYYYGRQYDEAIRHYSSAIDRHGNWTAYLFRGLALSERRAPGDIELATTDFARAARLNPAARHEIDGAYGYLCAVTDQATAAAQVITQLRSTARPGVPLSLAALYAGLGAIDLSFEWLHKAFEDPNEVLFWFAVDPRFDPLRADPRHSGILARLGLGKALLTH